MIIGVGTDILDVERFVDAYKRKGEAFLKRLFCAQEYDIGKNHPQKIRFFAKRFCAKEAVVKALGTGFRDGVSWHDIMILKDRLGKPNVVLLNRASDVLKQKSELAKIELSISDEKRYALAFVVISD